MNTSVPSTSPAAVTRWAGDRKIPRREPTPPRAPKRPPGTGVKR